LFIIPTDPCGPRSHTGATHSPQDRRTDPIPDPCPCSEMANARPPHATCPSAHRWPPRRHWTPRPPPASIKVKGVSLATTTAHSHIRLMCVGRGESSSWFLKKRYCTRLHCEALKHLPSLRVQRDASMTPRSEGRFGKGGGRSGNGSSQPVNPVCRCSDMKPVLIGPPQEQEI